VNPAGLPAFCLLEGITRSDSRRRNSCR
jgi:hypothetical protein